MARTPAGAPARTSFSSGALASLSDSSGSLSGQSMPSRGVVPADAGVGLGVVQRGALVGEGGEFGQHAEAVRETFRHPEMALVLGGQHHADPVAEGRRAATDVHRHVVDLALEHADQLALRIRPLVMQAAQHAPGRARDVGLHEAAIDAGFAVLRLVVAFVEEAARIAEHLRFDDHGAGQAVSRSLSSARALS